MSRMEDPQGLMITINQATIEDDERRHMNNFDVEMTRTRMATLMHDITIHYQQAANPTGKLL